MKSTPFLIFFIILGGVITALLVLPLYSVFAVFLKPTTAIVAGIAWWVCLWFLWIMGVIPKNEIEVSGEQQPNNVRYWDNVTDDHTNISVLSDHKLEKKS